MIPNPSDADQKDRPLRVRKGMIRTQGAGGRNPVAKRVMEATNPKLLKVGDLARQTGKSVRALHLYEELGLLHPTARSHGGFRLYDATAKHMQDVSLQEFQDGELIRRIDAASAAWDGHRWIFQSGFLRTFAAESGLKVQTRFDTEASKTVGLVSALLEERARPRCDVFWNNEILMTIRLQRAGMLEPYDSSAAKPYPASA